MILALSIATALSALLLIFLLLISPSFRKHPDAELLKGAYIAHRGLHSQHESIPENSLPAFQRAVEKGFPIEMDLHLTKDKKVVVFHDHSVKRMCGAEGNIEKMTLQEIRSLRLGNTTEKIPTLEEVLRNVEGKVFLLIEFKVDRNAKALCTAANEILKGYQGTYMIQSFYPQVPAWYKKHRKDICRGQLASHFKKEGVAKFLLGNMLLNFMGRPDFIAYRHEDAKNPMRRLAVWLDAVSLGWTFDSQNALNDQKKDFQGYIFENFLPEIE